MVLAFLALRKAGDGPKDAKVRPARAGPVEASPAVPARPPATAR